MDVLDENFNSKKLFSNQNDNAANSSSDAYLNANAKSMRIGSPALKYETDNTDIPRNDSSSLSPPKVTSPDTASNRSNSNASLNSTTKSGPASGQAGRSQFTISDNESDRNSSSLETSFEMSTEMPPPPPANGSARKSTVDSLSRAGSNNKLLVVKDKDASGKPQLSLSNYSASSFDNTNNDLNGVGVNVSSSKSLATAPHSSKLLTDIGSPLSRTTQMIVETASSATNAFTDVVSNLISSNNSTTAANLVATSPDQYSFNNNNDSYAPAVAALPDLDSTSGKDDSTASKQKQAKTPKKVNSSSGMVVKAKKPWYSVSCSPLVSPPTSFHPPIPSHLIHPPAQRIECQSS